MQSVSYPESDSHSYIDDVNNGFREHAWSEEQYATKNYTDSSSYIKHMPDGYEVDLKEDYKIPKKKNKTSSESSSKKKKSNSTKKSDSSKKEHKKAKPLNETQIQDKFEKAIKDTYPKKE